MWLLRKHAVKLTQLCRAFMPGLIVYEALLCTPSLRIFMTRTDEDIDAQKGKAAS